MSRSEARHSAGPRPRARLTVRGTLVGFVVAVLGLALVGTAGPASAAVPTLGTTTPSVSGTAVSTVAVSDAITWTTSGGCSAVSGLSGAPYVHITIDGPGWAGIDLNTPNRNGVSLGGAFPQPQSDTFSGVQSSNALPALAGDYTVTESCQNSTGLSISGQFVAFIHFPGAGAAGTVTYPPKSSTTTSLAVAPNGSAAAGASVTLTATVSPAAAGIVTFKDGLTALGTGAVDTGTGLAVLTTSSLSVGSHSLTAAFAATASTLYDPSTSTAVSYSIVCASNCPTTVSIGASPASTQRAGQSVTFTASVTPSGAGGTVQFTDGGSPLGSPVTATAGQAQLATSALTVGSHTIGATYTPGGIYAPGTASTVSYSITVVTTSTTLAASPLSTQVPGGNVTLTATVSPSASGTVQFIDGGSPIGSPVTVTAGSAQFATSFPSVGSHSFSADFTSTDVGYASSSTASATSYSIAVASTTTTLGVSPASSASLNATVTLTATVSPATSGSVVFSDQGTPMGASVAVSAGHAVFTTSFASEGSHSFTAAFTSTNAGYSDSSTAIATAYSIVAVVQQHPTLALTVGPSGTTTTVVNERVPLTATLSVPEATGSVQFRDNGSPLGSPVTVSAGAATINATSLTIGSHSIDAVYTSDNAPAFTDATSAAVAHTVIDVPALGTVKPLVANNEASTTGLDTSPFLLETTSSGAPTGCKSFGSAPVQFGAIVSGTGTGWTDGVQLITPAVIGAGIVLPSGDYKASASDSMAAIAANNGLTLTTGTYTITVQCIQYSAVVGTFTGHMWFTDASHWQNTDPSASATQTTVSVSITPAGWSFAGDLVKFTATVTPASAAGTVKFTNTVLGQTGQIGTTATVSGGSATMSIASLPIGLYQVGAQFVPTNPATFSPSHELQTTPYFVRAIAPVSLVTAPSLTATGVVKQGVAILCRPGYWDGNKTGFSVTFVWTRNLVAIPGAVSGRYVTQAADGGKRVACRVYARNVGGVVSATTPAITVALTAASRILVAPSIAGTAAVGHVLTARAGTWRPTPSGYHFQWLRDGRPIASASRSVYRVVSADRGHRISVLVTALRVGAAPGYSTSKAVLPR